MAGGKGGTGDTEGRGLPGGGDSSGTAAVRCQSGAGQLSQGVAHGLKLLTPALAPLAGVPAPHPGPAAPVLASRAGQAQAWVVASSTCSGSGSGAGLPPLIARQLIAPMASRMIGMISVCRMAVT